MILCDLNQGYGLKLKYSSLDVFAVKSFFAGQLIQKKNSENKQFTI